MTYLNKIIQLCNNKKISLIFLRAPESKSYQKKVPKKFKAQFKKIVHQKNLKFIDISTLHFEKDCFVADGDHLSVKGATRLSKYLNSILN